MREEGALFLVLLSNFCSGALSRETSALQSYIHSDANLSLSLHPFIVTMLSKSQLKRAEVGKEVSMECEFHMKGYEVFSNPIIWEKTQQSEKSRINIQGVIQHPFAASKRFSLSFSAGQSNCYTVKLVIKDVRLEDAGNYTCEVRGKRSTVLNHVTHVLNVDGILYSLRITTTTSNPGNETNQPSSITVTENEAKIFQCISNTTCPAPPVTFHLGKFDLSSAPQWSQETTSMSGTPGLKIMFCSVTRWLKLTLRERDDQKVLRCSVEPGIHQQNWTELLINVFYAPIIQCEPATARLGDINVTLECSVRARPDLGTLYWVIDSNGTTMTSNERNNDYTILVRVRDDNVLVIQLILAYVRHNSFRKYHIEARNAIGSSNSSVLLERYPPYGLPLQPNNPYKSPMVQTPSSRLFNNRHNERYSKFRIPSSTPGCKRLNHIVLLVAPFFHALTTVSVTTM